MLQASTHGGETPLHVQTHLSHIFLTRKTAYKLKRAMRLDFVDYSQLGHRHFYCLREVEVNQAWAGDLYKGVLAIRRTDKGLTLGGRAGNAVEWLVHMHRFPEQDRLDRRLAGGLCDDQELLDFADLLALQHHRQEPVMAGGGLASFLELVGQVTGGLKDKTADQDRLAIIEAWDVEVRKHASSVSCELENRRLSGRIKICHADLHLRNIVFWKDRLTGFDAIEFNDALRTIDTFYDLAFTVMDLVHSGYEREGNLLLNRYLANNPDYPGLRVLRLYLSVRAAIRALASTLGNEDDDCRAYLRSARLYLTPPRPAKLVAIGGLSGSGKSTVAQSVAPYIGAPPGAVVLRSDVIRKLIFGVRPEEKLAASSYDKTINEEVYATLINRCTSVLHHGYDCILDATFLDAQDQARIAALARRLGVDLTCIWLDATPDELHRRISGRRHDASDADHLVLQAQLQKVPPHAWNRIDTSQGVHRTARQVLDSLSQVKSPTFIQPDRNPAHDV